MNLLKTNKDIAPLSRENLQTFVYIWWGYEHQRLYIFATLFRSYIFARLRRRSVELRRFIHGRGMTGI